MKLFRKALTFTMILSLTASAVQWIKPLEVSANDRIYAEVYVSESGNDATADGTKVNPYGTIEAAQKKVREIQKSAEYIGGDIAINFRGGTYRIGTVRLDAAASGSEKGRVIYRAADGENVRMLNSIKLDVADLCLAEDINVLKRLPIAARGKVYVLDLSEYIDDSTYIGYPYLKNMGKENYGRRGATRLFLNNKPQTISRYPNTGYKDLLLTDGTSSIVNDGSSGEDVVLSFDEPNIMRWNTADDMVVRGYMTASYVGASYNVKSIDKGKRQIILDNIYNRALSVGEQFGPQRRWYAENLLEEIDIPGEYYVDEKEKKLYYYPCGDLSEQDTLELVCGRGGAGINMFELNGVSYVNFENLNLEQVSYKGISVRNSKHIIIDNCTVAYTHSNGIQIGKDCYDITVKNCLIHNTAGSGIYVGLELTNKQIEALESTDIVIENNHIYKAGENSTYPWAAIHSDGIGDVVKNNTIHMTPVCGVEFASPSGNFAYNEVYNTVYDSVDSGAMHIGGDWRRYGINVEYNYIHNIGNKDIVSNMPTAGIYWDEVHSGTVQKNNFIIHNSANNSRGIFMNGGRDHTAEDNVIVGAQTVFQNPNTHSGYYLVSPESGLNLHPTHSGLLRTYTNFLALYNDEDYKNSKHYAQYGDKMDELATDIAEYQLFSAKNLYLKNNVVVDCENVTNFKSNGRDNPLTAEQTRRYYTSDNVFTTKTIDFSSTVIEDNYHSAGTSRKDIFVNPEIGDYRVSRSGKKILNISDNKFELDDSFDITKIGCQNDMNFRDGFKMIYPKNGENVYHATSVELVWEKALFADEYEYTVYDAEGNAIVNGTTMYNTAKIDGLAPDTQYTWTVTAKYTSSISSIKNNGVKLQVSADEKGSFKTSAYNITVEETVYDEENSTMYVIGNNAGEERQAMLIVAKYEKNGKILKDCKVKNVTVTKGNFNIVADVSDEKNNLTNVSTVAYLWTADGAMKPLIDRSIYIK